MLNVLWLWAKLNLLIIMENLTKGPKWHPVMMLQVYPCLYLEVKQHFSVYFHSSVEMINRTNLWKCKVHTTYIGYAQCPVPWIKIHPMLHCFGIWPLEGTWNCLCSLLLPPCVTSNKMHFNNFLTVSKMNTCSVHIAEVHDQAEACKPARGSQETLLKFFSWVRGM